MVAEEHVRPSTAEEVGDLLSTRLARDDLERLLNLDPDDPATFQEHGEDPVGDADDGGEEMADDEDMDFQFEFAPGDLGLMSPRPPVVPVCLDPHLRIIRLHLRDSAIMVQGFSPPTC